MGPVSIVFDTSFGNTSSWYTLRLVKINSLRQPLRQALALARTELNKHGERRETLLHRLFPSFFPQFFARSLFLLLVRLLVFTDREPGTGYILLRASERGPVTPIKLFLKEPTPCRL